MEIRFEAGQLAFRALTRATTYSLPRVYCRMPPQITTLYRSRANFPYLGTIPLLTSLWRSGIVNQGLPAFLSQLMVPSHLLRRYLGLGKMLSKGSLLST